LPALCATPAPQGGACAPWHGSAGCDRYDNYCDPAAATCTKLRGVGQSCPALTYGSACVSIAACSAGTCVKLLGAGAACSKTEQCLYGMTCTSQVCTPWSTQVCP